MEIHAPRHPVLSVKEALVHLCLITAGILVALSLEGALEWRQHRVLVRETRERITSELRRNQESLKTVLKAIPPAQARFVHAVEAVSDLSTPEKVSEAATMFGGGRDNLSSGIPFAYFNTAAYTTATAVGAFEFMDYSEAITYADAYDIQAPYERMQDGAEKHVVAAGMLGTSIASKPTGAEIEEVKRRLRLAVGGLILMENIATKLDGLYG